MKQNKKKQKDTSVGKREQNRHIRQILSDAFSKSGKTVNRLLDEIRAETGFEISYNTLLTVIKPPSDDEDDLNTGLNLYAVIGACRCLHLDTAYVLSPPGTSMPPMSASSDLIHSSKFHILDDPKYFGSFYGYFYVPNKRRQELIEFKLEISGDSDTVLAKFTYYGRSASPGHNQKEDTRILYGTPILSAVSSNIFILLTNDMGDFYFMYYDRHYFRSTLLYYRRGLIATSATIGGYEPLFQSFVMFSEKMSPEKMRYIKGLLAYPHPTFYISKEEMDQLRAEEPIVERFYQENAYVLDHDVVKNVYVISESKFLWDPSDDNKIADTQALLLLKSRSMIPARTDYAENELISKFSKDFLLKPST